MPARTLLIRRISSCASAACRDNSVMALSPLARAILSASVSISLCSAAISRGARVFGATLVRNCYGLSGCWPPSTDLTGLPANGGFYFQAFSGSVALPAAGYDYNSVWTQRDLAGRRIFFFVSFFVRSEGPVSSSALRSRRRAQELSRLAVAPTSRHAPPLPGHTLTAPSTTARLVRFG